MTTGPVPPWILADDLTGAMEVAAILRRRGAEVRVPLVSAAAGQADGWRVLSSESRGLSGLDARAAVHDVLVRAGGGLGFKKIDSTLRGPVWAELQELHARFPQRQLWLCPANPRVGRTVVDGVLLVRGVPLAQSPFANDPGSPMQRSRVVDILDPAGGTVEHEFFLPLRHVRAGAERVRGAAEAAAREGRWLAICDAEAEADVDTLATAAGLAKPWGEPGLAVASAAWAWVLPGVRATPIVPSGMDDGRRLFVVGSRHPESARQLRRWSEYRGLAPVWLTQDAGGEAESAAEVDGRFTAGQDVILGLAPGDWDPAWAMKALARVVSHVRRPAVLFATGGETAAALCWAMGVTALVIDGEVEAGVVAARAEGVERPLWVVTKPGGFGDVETLVRIDGWLDAKSRPT